MSPVCTVFRWTSISKDNVNVIQHCQHNVNIVSSVELVHLFDTHNITASCQEKSTCNYPVLISSSITDAFKVLYLLKYFKILRSKVSLKKNFENVFLFFIYRIRIDFLLVDKRTTEAVGGTCCGSFHIIIDLWMGE